VTVKCLVTGPIQAFDEVRQMTLERALRIIAGIMVLISVLLTHFVSPWWILFTVFIGLNLLQSGFTNWCPMISILRALGMRDGAAAGKTDAVES
jgi:hypothetical protein